MSSFLPPLNSIRAFAIAARHLNFSRASEEIGVTPGAISKQVLLLEDFIGVKLFERLPGGLTLTPSGYALKTSIEPAFQTLNQAFSHYSRRPPRSKLCRVSTLASFAGHFLIPRLDKLAHDLPDVELEILTSQRLVDFAREEIDIGVRYGRGDWDDVVFDKLVDGDLLPVCAPELIKKSGAVNPIEFAAGARRIQLYSTDEWQSWRKFSHLEASHKKPAFIIEDSVVAIEATLSGQGIALLPEILVRKHLAAGTLVTFSPDIISWKPTYYITHSNRARENPAVLSVIDWLKSEAKQVLPDAPNISPI